MTSVTASAERTIRQHSDVPHFTCTTLRADQHAIIHNKSAAKAGANGEIDQIMVPHPGAVLPLTKCGQVGIVAEDDGGFMALFHYWSKRDVNPASHVRSLIHN